MKRQRIVKSQSRQKISGLGISGNSQRRGLVRSASEANRQREEDTKNNYWSASPIQTKLTIGQPNDKYEQEADRVAYQVVNNVNLPSSTELTQKQCVQETEATEEEEIQAKPDISSLQHQEQGSKKQPLEGKKIAISMLQRQAEEEEEKEETEDKEGELPMLQQEAGEEEQESIQTKATPGQTPNLSAHLEARIQSAKGGGDPLSDSTRSFMERHFGYDFSKVRVHTDSRAASASRELNAEAFTVGQNIFFGNGRYAPESTSGRQLLAHELTHTIQQTSTPVLRSNHSPESQTSFNQRNDSSQNEGVSASHAMAQNAPLARKAISQGDFGTQHLISLRRNSPQVSQPSAFSLESSAPPKATTVSEPSLKSEATGDKAAVAPKTEPQSTSTEVNKDETVPKEGVQEKLKDTKQAPSSPDEAPVSEVAVESPEPSESEAEEVAEVESLSLAGSSDQAMVKFLESSPSQIAATQPNLGNQLDSKINQEQQNEVKNAPILVAKTSGKVQQETKAPEGISVSGEAQIGDGAIGTDPGDLQASPSESLGTPPNNKDNEKLLDRQDENSFLGWLRNNRQSFLNNIRTTDTGVNTSAGKLPNVQLEGEANLERMGKQRGDAESQLKAQRDATANAFKHHPGQENIQPKKINQETKTNLSTDAFVSLETSADTGAMAYVNAPLPADVRQRADELLKPTLESNLAEAKAQTTDAANTRDRDKAAKINQAKSDAANVNQQADKEQRDIVVANRQKVARQQQEGLKESHAQVNEFMVEADKQQAANRKEIGEKVKTSEGEAGKELKKGEAKAEEEKKASERKAADKKKELEKAQEDNSWWDRAVSVIKSAVKKITSAIDGIFTALRKAVKNIIDKAKNAAIALINKARNWVIDKLNKFRDWAKNTANKYLKDRFPNLTKRINNAIDGVVDTAVSAVNLVADKAITGVKAVANGLAAGLDKVLSVFQTGLKGAVQIAGAVITGDFAEALRVAVQSACDIAGIDSKPIFDFINRAAGQVMAILKDPKTFFKNVMEAVGGGVHNFSQNIGTHLTKGLISWLTGALSEVAISLPTTFDAKGILSLVMQILGLTYENIKAKVIKKFPPSAKVIDGIEKGIKIVRKLVNEGPVALWEEVKQKISNLKELVMSRIRDFVVKTVVKEGITWLLSLLNPASAIVKLLKLVFDFVMFLVERFGQIKDFVMSVYNSIAAIAAGNLSQAKKAVEAALSRSLPVVISLLASLAGLGGIGKTVKNIIGKVANPVNKIVDNLVTRMVNFAKKLLKKGKAVGKKIKEKLVEWWKTKKRFTGGDGKQHTLLFKGTGKTSTLMVASKPKSIQELIAEREKLDPPKLTNKQNAALKAALAKNKDLNDFIRKNTSSSPNAGNQTIKAKIDAKLELIKADLIAGDAIPASTTIPLTNITYQMENGRSHIVEARPLTKLPGNTRGSKPDSNPTTPKGWPHVIAIDGPNPSNWVRAHLVNENLHGPGRVWNVAPGTQRLNAQMREGVEKDAKDAIKANPDSTILHYKAQVTYYEDAAKPYVNDFPKEIKITWGHLRRNASDPTKFEEKDSRTKPYTQGPPPASLSTAGPPSINDMSRRSLEALFDGKVGLAAEILNAKKDIPGGKFNSLIHIMTTMNKHYQVARPNVNFLTKYWPAIQTKYFEKKFRIS
ncbi:DUF4157 domain-containing protein [Crocosphaera sp.]|uniref:eCIS core domain-containing protein n=1 Tax=Crocosphaera sp. TaxID=2729996 RepID=UPI00260767AD|nr:DUF4157 domain-containing protein [Crocosphaera sp.]MDJ0582121.1 DUF4157 domain-containing protein [Crocosphaera sp.]